MARQIDRLVMIDIPAEGKVDDRGDDRQTQAPSSRRSRRSPAGGVVGTKQQTMAVSTSSVSSWQQRSAELTRATVVVGDGH
jgi:hypothetical protein